MSLRLSTDDDRQNETKNRYTAKKKQKLKHNTGKEKKTKELFFF
jgi:hypothetical protein